MVPLRRFARKVPLEGDALTAAMQHECACLYVPKPTRVPPHMRMQRPRTANERRAPTLAAQKVWQWMVNWGGMDGVYIKDMAAAVQHFDRVGQRKTMIAQARQKAYEQAQEISQLRRKANAYDSCKKRLEEYALRHSLSLTHALERRPLR